MKGQFIHPGWTITIVEKESTITSCNKIFYTKIYLFTRNQENNSLTTKEVLAKCSVPYVVQGNSKNGRYSRKF